jgi:hypothetical protein
LRAAFLPQPAPLPPGALPVADQVRIRDRATILGRQLYAEQGPAFADGQVAALLAALHIDAAALPGGLHHAHDAAWHGIWQQQGRGGPPPVAAAEVAAAQHTANMEAAWREQQAARPWCASGGGGGGLDMGQGISGQGPACASSSASARRFPQPPSPPSPPPSRPSQAAGPGAALHGLGG